MGADGAYSLAGLPAGSYKVYTQTNTPAFPDQWFGGTTSRPPPPSRSAPTRPRTSPSSRRPPSPSAGIVKDGAATPVNGTFVYVFDATTSAYMGAATMGAAGAYSLAGLPAGSYKVYTQTNTPAFPDQWSGGTDFATATAIPVSANTVQDITLAPSAPNRARRSRPAQSLGRARYCCALQPQSTKESSCEGSRDEPAPSTCPDGAAAC